MKLFEPLIYIIDDDPFYLEVISKKLMNAGFANIRCFTSAIEALQSGVEKPNVLFVDFHMDDINGTRASRLFSKKWMNTRIVLISASDSIKSKVKKKRFGIDATVVKREDISDLILQAKIAKTKLFLFLFIRMLFTLLIVLGIYKLFAA